MRILAIGDAESLAETRRVLSRSQFEIYRVPAALAAVRMVRQIPFDLMIVVHPLADTDFAGFHGEIRARHSPCRDTQLLVLAPRSRLAEVDGFREDPRLEALDVDQPQHRLAEAAARYLGPIRVATRYDLRLPARWGAAQRRSHTVDISASGVLISCAAGDRPPLGARFEVELELGETTSRLRSEVVRHADEPADKAAGFAVTWIRAASEEMDRLDALLADLG